MKLRITLIILTLLCCGILYSGSVVEQPLAVVECSLNTVEGEPEFTLNGTPIQPDDPLIGDLNSGWKAIKVEVGATWKVVCTNEGSGCLDTIRETYITWMTM